MGLPIDAAGSVDATLAKFLAAGTYVGNMQVSVAEYRDVVELCDRFWLEHGTRVRQKPDAGE
jgi:hypothetical protein